MPTKLPEPPPAPHSKPSLIVRLDDDTLQALDDWARQEGLTAGTLARRLIEDKLREKRRA